VTGDVGYLSASRDDATKTCYHSRQIGLSVRGVNTHANVYGAVIMTKVIARVRPVRLTNAD